MQRVFKSFSKYIRIYLGLRYYFFIYIHLKHFHSLDESLSQKLQTNRKTKPFVQPGMITWKRQQMHSLKVPHNQDYYLLTVFEFYEEEILKNPVLFMSFFGIIVRKCSVQSSVDS